MSRPRPVGVLGGTFDPVHLGHLEIAQRALEAARLARVLLVPAFVPPHKRGAPLTPARHREAMLRLAVVDRPALEVSTIELEAGRVCYTIDTLRGLRAGPPAVAPVFILGMDSLRDLGTWKDYRALIREFDLLVVDRPGRPSRLPAEVERALVEVAPGAGGAGLGAGRGGRIFHLPMAPIPISSSDIRRRAAEGGDLTGLVPSAVAGYIRSMGLYGPGQVEESH